MKTLPGTQVGATLNSAATPHKQVQASAAPDERQQIDEDDASAVSDPLADLKETERLALAIRFGRIRMCAALTHGHSFESSIFRLPAKCVACHELVWGPFTRGCVCLVCKLTAHRSCTSRANMPQCLTKDLFVDFCRSEVGMRRRPATRATRQDPAEAMPPSSNRSSSISSSSSSGSSTVQQQRHSASDLDGWAKVEEATSEGSRRCSDNREIAFSWSPFGFADRKRAGDKTEKEPRGSDQQPEGVTTEVLTRGQGQAESSETRNDESVTQAPSEDQEAEIEQSCTSTRALGCVAADKDSGANADVSAVETTTTASGIRDVGKMSVAGGVVGAVLGGPAGAVVGLKLGAFLGAGRWSAQGLWKRIEKERREAGAATDLAIFHEASIRGVAAATPEEDVEEDGKLQDIWAQIAKRVQGESPVRFWELDPAQKELLEQGECDAEEVAMFVVGKVLADETAMPSRLYAALVREFRARHRPLVRCRHGKPRSNDSDMVALFPRAEGSRRALDAASGSNVAERTVTQRGKDANVSAPDEGMTLFASTPGLEKTFSFVEEAEIVEGEGSEAALGDSTGNGYCSSVDGEPDGSVLQEGESSHGTNREPASSPERTPRTTADSTSPVGQTPTTVAATASKDVSRTNSCRMDSWVRLEGGVCSSCGGRVCHAPGRFLCGSVGRDPDDDEGELGGSWAGTDTSPCWYADEDAPSASPEVVHLARSGSSGSNRPPPAGAGAPMAGAALLRHHTEEDTGTGRGSPVSSVGRSAPSACIVAADEDGRYPADVKASSSQGQAEGATSGPDKPHDALRDVHGVLRELTRAVLAACPLLATSREATIQAVNCIDQRVFCETYGPVYSRIASRQACERDAMLQREVRKGERSRLAAGRPSLALVCEPKVLAALRAVGAARTGRDKLAFLVEAVEKISEALPPKATTDMLLWSLCRHLAAATLTTRQRPNVRGWGKLDASAGDAPLQRPHAEVAFVEQFVRDESWLRGKQGYVLTTVDAALHILLNPAMSAEIFVDPSLVQGKDDTGISHQAEERH